MKEKEKIGSKVPTLGLSDATGTKRPGEKMKVFPMDALKVWALAYIIKSFLK